MKIGFFGDTSFHNKKAYDLKFFPGINLNNLDLSVFNFESSIFDSGKVKDPIKKKTCVFQDNLDFLELKKINKNILLNLSNNHINDYGNEGVNNTINTLKSNNILYFGAGYNNTNHNIFEHKNIVFFSYSTKEVDRSSKILFNTKNLMGPKELSIELFKKQSKSIKNKHKVVLLHWGDENISYPSRKQKDLARELIDSGADLIIGSHSHRVQGFEKYKGKYIFYSLGNFFFPDVYTKTSWRVYKKKQKKKDKISIVPIFNIGDKIELDSIKTYFLNDNFKFIVLDSSKINTLTKRLNSRNYALFYLVSFFEKKCKEYIKIPLHIYKKFL